MRGLLKSKRKKEIELERYRTFQKRDARALRFGSMNSITFRFGGNFEPRAGGMFVGARQHRDWDSGVFEAMTASRERGGETVKVGLFLRTTASGWGFSSF